MTLEPGGTQGGAGHVGLSHLRWRPALQEATGPQPKPAGRKEMSTTGGTGGSPSESLSELCEISTIQPPFRRAFWWRPVGLSARLRFGP